MKSLKKWSFLIILFLVIATIQSCDKDDDIVNPDAVTDMNPDTIDDGPAEPSTIGGEGEITLYRVDGDNLIKEKDYKVTGKALEFQKDVKKHQEIWELTKKIIPTNYQSKMSEFIIFAGESDGTAGYVYNTNRELSKWAMGIAIDFAYDGGFNADGELAYTIIHEFGHILTLNDTQTDYSVIESSCKNFYAGEGCARKESYINTFYNRFWADVYGEFLEAERSESQDLLVEFYNKYKDRFVTEYASTNPGEDIAEVFATFVTRNGGVQGNSIAEQKIQLMYESSELIDIRNYIRSSSRAAKGSYYLPEAGTWKKANTFGKPKDMHCTKPKG